MPHLVGLWWEPHEIEDPEPHQPAQVFERLGLSLYDFLRKNSYKPFHLNTVRDFGQQLLRAVAYLHDLQLIHTDLKPENILLQSSEYDKQTPPPGSRCASGPRFLQQEL